MKNTHVLCILAFALVASGCSSRDSNELTTDAQTSNDDAPDRIVIEVTPSTDTSDGTATPVAPVSTFEMDDFVSNPLLRAIPAELDDGDTPAPTSYVVNPLIN